MKQAQRQHSDRQQNKQKNRRANNNRDQRRMFLKSSFALAALYGLSACHNRVHSSSQVNLDDKNIHAANTAHKSAKQFPWGKTMKDPNEKVTLSDKEWKERLSEQSYRVLRKEGTEKPGTSELLNEKREGDYLCAGCGLVLFTADMKYDSGTGWPSFFKAVEEHIETKRDLKLLYPRTEYHCKRCGGHQGHVFNDGPEPTGKRWCNNGVALTFAAKS